MNPFFSIVIPVYNREKTIGKTLDSILSQNFKDYEVIVVDDCSKDRSIDVVKQHELDVHIIKNEVNSERCVSRNNGLAAANGKYVCFLDSDDYYLPDHLEKFHQFILSSDQEKALYFSNCLIDDSGNIYEKHVPELKNQNVFEYLLQYTPNPVRVCLPIDVAREFQFDPEIPGIEDLDVWLRVATKYPVRHIISYTCAYVWHEDMYTMADPKRYEKELRYFTYIFQKEELASHLPSKSKKRLLSMCHHFLAINSIGKGSFSKRSFYRHAWKALFLCPKGYNGKSTKPLIVQMIYEVPVFGKLLKKIKSKA